jgi:hypothetical protein
MGCVYLLVNGDEFVEPSWSNHKRCVQIQNDGDIGQSDLVIAQKSTLLTSLEVGGYYWRLSRFSHGFFCDGSGGI